MINELYLLVKLNLCLESFWEIQNRLQMYDKSLTVKIKSFPQILLLQANLNRKYLPIQHLHDLLPSFRLLFCDLLFVKLTCQL